MPAINLKRTPAESAAFGQWYSINGELAAFEDGEVMAASGLPFGDYRVASDFVRKLRAVSEITPGYRVRVYTVH